MVLVKQIPTRPTTHKRKAKAAKHEPSPRLSSTQRGYGYKWQQAREGYLRKHPLCANHLVNGYTVVATDVDHIIPHKGDIDLFWDSSNWQPLCHECHSIKTAREDGGVTFASMTPRYITKPSKPLIVVCGMPAAGKTTYAKSIANSQDMYIDLDDMRIAKYGTKAIDGNDINMLIKDRNRLIDAFCLGKTNHDRCILIATCGSFKHRKYWSDLGAKVVVIDTCKDECIDRVNNRPISDTLKRDLINVINNWG